MILNLIGNWHYSMAQIIAFKFVQSLVIYAMHFVLSFYNAVPRVTAP